MYTKNWTWNWKHSWEQSKFTWFGSLNVWYHILSCKPHKKAKGFNNGYQQKVLLKLKLMDGLSKKIIALVGKSGCVLRERTGSTERMMGSDSGLSGRTGCPEECEAGLWWQSRTGCQSGESGFNTPWEKQGGQPVSCSAVLKEEGTWHRVRDAEQGWGRDRGSSAGEHGRTVSWGWRGCFWGFAFLLWCFLPFSEASELNCLEGLGGFAVPFKRMGI